MKKAIFLPMFLMIGLMSNAWGACNAVEQGTGAKNNNILWLMGEGGKGYACAESGNYCRQNAIVFVPEYMTVSKYDGDGKNAKLDDYTGPTYFTCYEGAQTDDRWVKETGGISVCNLSPLRQEVSGSRKVYTTDLQLNGNASSTNFTGIQTVTAVSGTPCVAYFCPENKIPNSDKNACVENTDQNNCTSTGGTWDGQRCSCSHADLVQDGDKKCKCSRGSLYTWGGNQCVSTVGGGTYADVDASAERTRQTTSERRTSCSNSGGSYANRRCNCSAPNTRVQNYACLCQSGYRWKNENDKSQGCVMTNETAYETACDAAVQNGQARKNTYPSLSCVCNDGGYELDVNAGECKPTVERAACDVLTQQNKARWNTAQKACVCSQTGYEFDGNTCVETAEGAAARKANELATAKAKIENVHSKLKKTQDGFKVSAWKNEEGNFNTARLASDSIAGVVVGTAGGLLTSKIVKKNQVEDGFEDIQCTIGGQTVAGWGDEFSVGNQM